MLSSCLVLAGIVAGAGSLAVAQPSDHPSTMTSRAAGLADNTGTTVSIDARFTFSSAPLASAPVSDRRSTRKRIAYTLGGSPDNCGETYPQESFDSNQPLQADCNAITDWAANAAGGFWTVAPGDCGGDGWCRLVSAGTCSFGIRFTGQDGQNARIGTNDIHYYTESYARDAQGGRIGAEGGIACTAGSGNGLVILDWGLIQPS